MTYTLHPAAEQDVADAMDAYLAAAGHRPIKPMPGVPLLLIGQTGSAKRQSP